MTPPPQPRLLTHEISPPPRNNGRTQFGPMHPGSYKYSTVELAEAHYHLPAGVSSRRREGHTQLRHRAWDPTDDWTTDARSLRPASTLPFSGRGPSDRRHSINGQTEPASGDREESVISPPTAADDGACPIIAVGARQQNRVRVRVKTAGTAEKLVTSRHLPVCEGAAVVGRRREVLHAWCRLGLFGAAR